QENKTCRARWRERWRAGMLLSERLTGRLAELGHLDRGHGSIVAFVAMRAAGPCFGLRQRVGGENSERNWRSGFEGHLLQTVSGGPANVIEMRSFPADHGAQSDDPVELFSEFARGLWKFKSTGNVKHGNSAGTGLGES